MMMRKAIGLLLLVVAMSTTTGCTKNKKRADRLEEELLRCKTALQQAQADPVDHGADGVEYASLTCGEGEVQ